MMNDHGYISDKDRYLARLKRIEGQTRCYAVVSSNTVVSIE